MTQPVPRVETPTADVPVVGQQPPGWGPDAPARSKRQTRAERKREAERQRLEEEQRLEEQRRLEQQRLEQQRLEQQRLEEQHRRERPAERRPPERRPPERPGPPESQGKQVAPDRQGVPQTAAERQRVAEGARPDTAAVGKFSIGRSGFTAALAGLLTVTLIFGSRLDHVAYAGVCLAIQALFVAAWTWGGRSPGPYVVAGAGLVAAAGADVTAVYSAEASLAPLGYVVAGAFVLGVIGQLVRGEGRTRVTESIGAVAVVTVGVVALATPILLSRYPAGTEALLACLLAAGVGLVVARLSDLVLRTPRVSEHVPRGAPGVVLGGMVGTAAAGWAGSVLVGLSPGVAAMAGVVVAVAAVLADLGMVFAETGRLLAGEDASRWMVRAALGPLVALAVAAPAAYLLSVLMLVKNF